MNWIANATKKDAETILVMWPGLKINVPVPKKQEADLIADGLVGIYGNYPSVGKRTTESDES
ncbi:MAG: hypothetical protein V3V68_05095 [Nitrosomonadaceae bacterium]